MPPRHVGVHGCFPEPWQSIKGSLRAPDPKDAARAKPWCFWSKPKARPGAAGDCECPRGAQGPCNPGWAGPRAPEPPSAPTAAPQGASAASPASTGSEMLNLGSARSPTPAQGQNGAFRFAQNPGLSSPPLPRANRSAPGGCSWAGCGVSCTLQGSAQLGWGKAVLVLGAGRAPGPEAAAAQLIPALAGLRQPRHILSLPAPGRPQDSRVTVPALAPATEPPGHRTTASAAATVMDRASPKCCRTRASQHLVSCSGEGAPSSPDSEAKGSHNFGSERQK